MAYSENGETLLTQVVDIPVGGGKDEKTHKHLFQPPFLAEAENIEVNKTGSSQKRDGIHAVIPPATPSSGLQPMAISGTVFEHSDGQLGVIGQSDFSTSGVTEGSTLSVIENNADFTTAQWQPSNKTGIYACGIEEDAVVRTDEAVIHTQSSVSGNLVITVWCSAVDPVTLTECYAQDRTIDNRCYYMVKERDTGTVVVPPSRLYSSLAPGYFDQNPRYTHIALVDNADPHWIVVAAPELYQENTVNYLTAASISVTTNVVTYRKLDFVDGQTTISKFTAFDMHAGKDSETSALSDHAHIIAQAALGSGHSDYIFRIDKTLTVSLARGLANNEVPEHCGAIFHDVSLGKVFTAVSNQDGIAGALAGDGETWVHAYNHANYAVIPGYPVKAFAQTVPAAWPSQDIGITGACTRLSIFPGAGTGDPYSNTSLFVFGTQFWDPAGYQVKDPNLAWSHPASATALDKSVNAIKLVGSKSFLNTKWVEINDAYTGAPSVTTPVDQGSCYITTKGFKGLASDYPMIGLSVTNGSPLTAYKLGDLAETSESKFKTRLPPQNPPGPVSPKKEPQAGNSSENQPCKHPMGVIASPLRNENFLRPVARFGVDLVTEAEDVFPYESGIVGSDDQGFANAQSRWASPGLSEVHTTQVAGEFLFTYRSRLTPGVARMAELNRLKITGAAVAGGGYSSIKYGVMFSTNAAGAFGGEEVRLNTADTRLVALKDRDQTYFSGGYLGFFDGVDNGESDTHSSPGQPFVQLYSKDLGLLDYSRPENVTVQSNAAQFRVNEKARYSFVLVYALYDENGRVHRSAPSPEKTVNAAIDYATGTVNTIGAVAIRYLMPPLSSFWKADQESRAKKFVIEVYAKVDNQMTNIDGGSDRDGSLLNVSSYTMIDSFEPEVVPTLQQKFHDYNASSPAGPVTGVSTTPWTVRDKQLGYVRSGFKFFGERVIYRPKFFLADNRTDKENTVSAGEFSTTTLYTNGGVLENDPPPAFSCIHTANRRMWGLPTNDRHSVWYSKLLSPGKAPEWSSAFSMATPRSDGEMVAISAMDEKVVLFSRRATFILVGDGPNNLGRGSGFNGPRKVAVGIGCVNRSSVVTGPFGVMFQSEKGIHVLNRGLQVTYIGDKVEDQITSENDIVSAVLVEDKHQVRFTLNTSGQTHLKILVYDYFHDVWTVFTSASAVVKNSVSATVHNGKYVALGSDNYVSREVAGSNYDGQAVLPQPIISKFTTAWIKLAGLQGFKRVKRVSFLGQHLGGKVSLSAQYNYNESVSTTKTWTDAEITALSNDPMQLGLHIPRQKCQSIRFIYTDEDAGVAPSAGSVVSSISILLGIKNGLFKLPEGGKK